MIAHVLPEIGMELLVSLAQLTPIGMESNVLPALEEEFGTHWIQLANVYLQLNGMELPVLRHVLQDRS
jgi:hypothetical protein